MKPTTTKKTKESINETIIQNQKVQIMALRKQVQNLEAKLIALGH